MSYYPHLNDIFITNRLKQRLEEISSHPVTTVIAPMGFGKTTSVNWWAKRNIKSHKDLVILRQMVATDSLTDFWNGFCKAFKRYPVLFEQMKALGYPKDAAGFSVLSEILTDTFVNIKIPLYLIIDDLHILNQTVLAPIMFFVKYGFIYN